MSNRQPSHYVTDIPEFLGRESRYSIGCQKAYKLVMADLMSGDITLPEAVIRLRREYAKNWR